MRSAALAALLLLAAPAAAQPKDDGVRVFIDKSERVAPLDGYVALPVSVENVDRRPRRIDLEFTSKPWATVTRRVELDPGERRTVFVQLPAAARYWTARIDTGAGEVQHDNLLWQTPPLAPVLVVGGVEEAKRCVSGTAWDPGVANSAAHSTGPERAPDGVALVSGENLPDLLAGYVGYRAVLLLGSSFQSLPEPQRRALEAYAATGGNLYLGRDPELSPSALPLLAAIEQTQAGLRDYGLGRVANGEGSEGCAPLLEAMGAEGTPPAYDEEPVRRAMRATNQPQVERRGGPAQDLLLEVARAPTGAFALIVLLFAAVIGPGSFIVRRKYGPHALLAFIPATSLVTCLGIAGYGAVHEGLFTVHHTAHAVTILDEARHRAITAATSAWYPSLSPREVRFGAMTALVTPASSSSAGRNLVLDTSDGVAFRGGLLPSRTYREYLTLSVEPTRARLGLRGSGSGFVVENALGSRILWGKARVGGKTCHFEEVADGASVEAVDCAEPHEPPTRLPKTLGKRGYEPAIQRTALAPLQDGDYVVFLQKAVFVPDGGLELKSSDELQLVRGRSR